MTWRPYLDPIVAAARAAGPERCSVLLLRHSIREPIASAATEAALLAPLTDEGRAMARAFGGRLDAARPVRIFHSAVPRCVETAELIAEGLRVVGGAPSVAGARRFLGAPYLHDPEGALGTLGDDGIAGFVRSWVEGRWPASVIDPIRDAGLALLRDLEAESESAPAGTLDIHVTHDMTILALLSLSRDLSDPQSEWPDYLEGVSISRTSSGASIRWRAGPDPD